MKKIYFISLLLVLVSVNGFAAEAIDNPALKTIFSRKSVRHFTADPVSKEQLMMLVKAGMAAPTAVDKRPWDFIIITDRAVLDKLSNALPYAKMLTQAPAAIVVTGDLNRQFGGKSADSWITDCSAATENILLAAESMGLGAVWTAAYPDVERVKVVKAILNIPADIVPLNIIPIGVPTGEDKPKDKFNSNQIHNNTW